MTGRTQQCAAGPDTNNNDANATENKIELTKSVASDATTTRSGQQRRHRTKD